MNGFLKRQDKFMEEKSGHEQGRKGLKYKPGPENFIFQRLCHSSYIVQSVPQCLILSRCPWTVPDQERAISTGLRLLLCILMSLTLEPQ